LVPTHPHLKDPRDHLATACLKLEHGSTSFAKTGISVEEITHKREVANMRSAGSSCNNLATHRPLLRKTIALSAAEIPRFGVLASSECARNGVEGHLSDVDLAVGPERFCTLSVLQYVRVLM